MADIKRTNVGREIVTAAIGLGIFVTTAYMLVRTFNYGAQGFGDEATPAARAMQAAYGRQKDMLLYALSLLGTVTGYYLGRVPAERAADRAFGEAAHAKTRSAAIAVAAQSVVRKSEEVVGGVEQQRRTLSSRSESEPEQKSMDEFRTAVDVFQRELVK
jgi:hypothetical protein